MSSVREPSDPLLDIHLTEAYESDKSKGDVRNKDSFYESSPVLDTAQPAKYENITQNADDQDMNKDPSTAPSPSDNTHPDAFDFSPDTTSKSTSQPTGKFRFKSKSKSESSRHRSDSRSPSRSHSQSYQHSSSSSTRRHTKRPKVFTGDDPSSYDDSLDPDMAFRESLFDAMADDEGASFWESVYGQPIHNYARPSHTFKDKSPLDVMTDNEYANYVRAEMYKKSHEYIFEERARREKEKKRLKKEEEQDRKDWQRTERERLLKEQERRKRKGRRRWDEYVQDWERILAVSTATTATSNSRNSPVEMMREKMKIPWPVNSGKLADVSQTSVEAFLRSANLQDTRQFSEMLRRERVRWHPDKAMQRWGRDKMDEETLKGVTSVFQVIDGLWNDNKA